MSQSTDTKNTVEEPTIPVAPDQELIDEDPEDEEDDDEDEDEDEEDEDDDED